MVGDLLQCNLVRVRIFLFICATFSFKISFSESDLSPSSSLSTLLLCRSCYVVASSLSTAPWKWNICSVLFVSIAVVSIFFAGSFFLTNDHRGFFSVKNWCYNLIWTKFLWTVICIHNSWFKSWNLRSTRTETLRIFHWVNWRNFLWKMSGKLGLWRRRDLVEVGFSVNHICVWVKTPGPSVSVNRMKMFEPLTSWSLNCVRTQLARRQQMQVTTKQPFFLHHQFFIAKL